MSRNGLSRSMSVEQLVADSEEQPSRESMRGSVQTPRNPTRDQTRVRRRQQRTAAENGPRLEKCPNCNRQVEILSIQHDGGHKYMTCPNCGQKSPLAGKEGRRMSNTPTVAELLREAARAESGAECARLVGEAERLRSEGQLAAESSRQLDLAGTEVRERIVPGSVHELHTAATDWVAEIDTAGEDARQHMIASATEWYGGLHPAIAADAGEFRIQAEGMAFRESGSYGEAAEPARQTFLSMCATLRARDIGRGRIAEATVTGDAGEPQGAADVLGENPPTGEGYQGLPGDQTSSMRAPQFGDMSGDPGPNDSSLGDGSGSAEIDAANGDAGTGPKTSSRHTANGGSMPEWLKDKVDDESDGDPDAPDPENKKKEGSVQHIATCPSCQGFGGVATSEEGRRRIATLIRQGYSGLHQLDEIADPKDDPSQTPYPTDEAFPMEQGGWNPANGPQKDISQAEQQIGEREQRKGASLEDRARWAAAEAYRQVHAAARPADPWDLFRTAVTSVDTGAQDDSGWLGDMGAGGRGPGMQDAPPPGGSNLGMADPVYGQGGDQPPGPRQPVGSDERDDETNQPSSWAPGQQTQNDVADRGRQLPPSGAPGFPDNGGGYGNAGGNQFQNQKSSARTFDDDPEVIKARQFLAQRRLAYQG